MKRGWQIGKKIAVHDSNRGLAGPPLYLACGGTKAPTLFQLNVDDNMQPKLAFLLELFDGYQESARFVVLRYPALLSCSVEKNLKPKVAFLSSEVYGGDLVALRSAILSSPAMLGLSPGRIKQRFGAIISIGMDPTTTSLSFTKLKDDKFDTWLANRKKELMAKGLHDWR